MSEDARWPKWPILVGGVMTFLGVLYGATYLAAYFWDIPEHGILIANMTPAMIALGLPWNDRIRIASRRAFVLLLLIVIGLTLTGLVAALALAPVMSLPPFRDGGVIIWSLPNLAAVALIFGPAYWAALRMLRRRGIMLEEENDAQSGGTG